MLFFGIFTIILGILVLLSPFITGAWVVLLIGLLVVAAGIARMIWAFRSGSLGKTVLRFFVGLLTLLCGIALVVTMVTNPVLASGIITIILAIYLIVDGVFEVATAIATRRTSGWGWLLAGGIISVLLGVMIWSRFPLSGIWAIGVFLGIKLLFIGTDMIFLRVVRGKAQPALAD